jgi:hypothetical protein
MWPSLSRVASPLGVSAGCFTCHRHSVRGLLHMPPVQCASCKPTPERQRASLPRAQGACAGPCGHGAAAIPPSATEASGVHASPSPRRPTGTKSRCWGSPGGPAQEQGMCNGSIGSRVCPADRTCGSSTLQGRARGDCEAVMGCTVRCRGPAAQRRMHAPFGLKALLLLRHCVANAASLLRRARLRISDALRISVGTSCPYALLCLRWGLDVLQFE